MTPRYKVKRPPMADTEKPRLGLIARIIDASARKRVFVFGITIMLAIWGVVSATRSQLDALPDLSDTQVIVAARVTSTGNGFAVAILIDGEDVTGASSPSGEIGCRLYAAGAPSVDQIRERFQIAAGGSPSGQDACCGGGGDPGDRR